MELLEQLLVTPFTTGELLASKAVVPILIAFSGDVDFPDFGVLVSGAADGQYSENLCRDGGLCTVHRWAGTCHFGLQQNHAAGTFDCVCDARSDGIAFGAFTPVDNMPDWIQTITWADPLRFALLSVRRIYLADASWAHIAYTMIPTAAVAAVSLPFAYHYFKKRL